MYWIFHLVQAWRLTDLRRRCPIQTKVPPKIVHIVNMTAVGEMSSRPILSAPWIPGRSNSLMSRRHRPPHAMPMSSSGQRKNQFLRRAARVAGHSMAGLDCCMDT
ncbi:hypothetical protein C8259_28250 [Nocardia nova]|uniref:Uncharacterized protein n=1 Tax=Nocardia nova TaxID=37330 RepID=A0A2T2YU69_9NOCA|nr:hypothetical protein C8259_28250 [Nocardia nova]